MNDSNILIPVIGVLLAVFALYKLNIGGSKSQSHEKFGMLPSRTWKVDRVAAESPCAMKKGDFYSVPGNYQSILEPRFSNVDYGANIRYNMPSYEHQAAPCDPLEMGQMVRENYSETKEDYGCGACGGGCGAVGCGKCGVPLDTKAGAPMMKADYANGNFNEVTDRLYKEAGAQYPEATSMLPVSDMTTLNALGEVSQPIIYDRYIYANRNSRLRSQGDPIRGDLPIVPCAADWFRPSVHPNIDLQEGAMNVLGGNWNETSAQLADLIYQSSGRADRTFAGVDMSSQYLAKVSNALSDVTVSAFP